MIKTILTSLFLLIPGISKAQSVSYTCNPSKVFNPAINVKNDKIVQIKSLSIPMAANPTQYRADLTFSVLSMVDEMNGRTKARDVSVSFKLKELKSGSLLELDTSAMDEARFDALFLEIGNIDVATAGPIPPGKFPVKISLGMVASQFSMTSPMLFEKVILNCEIEVKF